MHKILSEIEKNPFRYKITIMILLVICLAVAISSDTPYGEIRITAALLTLPLGYILKTIFLS